MAGLQKILLVEDNPALRVLYKDFLAGRGYDVREASDGRQGLLIAQSFKPDLIFLDIMMPGLSGFQVTTALRHDPAYNCTSARIILLTNLGIDKIPAHIEAAIDGYALKVEIKLPDLIDIIQSFDQPAP